MPKIDAHGVDDEHATANGAPISALDRQRNAEAEISELKLAKMRGEVVDRDDMRELIVLIAECLQDASRKVEREFGVEARMIVDNAVETIRDKAATFGLNH